MIIDYTPPPVEAQFPSPWYRGDATLLLYLGHGEYGIPENDKVSVQVWSASDEEDGRPQPNIPDQMRVEAVRSSRIFNEAFGVVDPETGELVEDGWASVALLQGPVYELWRMFYLFSHQLDPQQDPADYTPGGDDDTFDYYPSAFECMEMWAKDMDQLQRLLTIHIANFPFDKHSRKRMIRPFTARRRIVEIVRNLYTAKGPFAEWEFEDHAQPYLREAGFHVPNADELPAR